MRRFGFCSDCNMAATAGAAQRHRKSDAARGAGDEERLALKGHVGLRSHVPMESWPGLSRPSTPFLLRPIRKTWMPATSAGMTRRGDSFPSKPAQISAPYSHIEPVERFLLLDRLQAIEQRHHLVAPEALRQQEEFLAQLRQRHRPLRRSLEARHLAGYFAAVLELDRDGRHQVAPVLPGRHRHLSPRREVENGAVLHHLLIEPARSDRLAVN